MPRILVVEDDSDQLRACVTRLERSTARHIIDTATNPEEAIRKLQNKQYDIVITDLRMPSDEYEGFMVILDIKRKDPLFERTKVIVWTVVGAQRTEQDIDAIRHALRLGVSDYIIKDWDRHLELLEKTIDKILLQSSSLPPRVCTIRGQVFLACPYDEHHDQICAELKNLENQVNYGFVRADGSFQDTYLKEIITTQIAESEFVVAFISGLNGNVMYELGLAHGMQKRVIIVKDENTNVLSDLGGIVYIPYKKDVALQLPGKIIKALNDLSCH
ncbi:MAG: response regulator [Pseudomonadota bacterium]